MSFSYDFFSYLAKETKESRLQFLECDVHQKESDRCPRNYEMSLNYGPPHHTTVEHGWSQDCRDREMKHQEMKYLTSYEVLVLLAPTVYAHLERKVSQQIVLPELTIGHECGKLR